MFQYKKQAEFTVYLDFSSPAWFFCWDVVCNSPHGVSVARDMWTTSGRTETVIIHSTEGVNWMKTGRTYLQLWLNKRQGIVVLCFWLSSVIWEQDPVSQPGRQQVLLPVVLLSRYTSRGLEPEPAPVDIPQWLWKKQKDVLWWKTLEVKENG